METWDAILTRRSVGKVKPDRPTKEVIERLLVAAVQAPNHHHNQPWRFYVIASKAREELGSVMAETVRQQLADPESEQGRALLAKEVQKSLRAPVLIVVAAKHSDSPKIVPIEDVEATGAAIENLLLVAHDMGLGAIWRTGKPAYDARVKQFFGLGVEDHIVGFVYVGYPEAPQVQAERPLDWNKVEWRGWE